MMYKTPDIVKEQREKLYDLCQNHHKDGLLTPRQVAEFLGKDYTWLFKTPFIPALSPLPLGQIRASGGATAASRFCPFGST